MITQWCKWHEANLLPIVCDNDVVTESKFEKRWYNY